MWHVRARKIPLPLGSDKENPRISVRVYDRSPQTRVARCDGTEMLQIYGSKVAG
jgi:hypothetical protein